MTYVVNHWIFVFMKYCPILALHFASRSGMVGTVKTLLAAGATLSTNGAGQTPKDAAMNKAILKAFETSE